MKKLIVPIDFSDGSFKGLDLAILFANKYNADIQMVYVHKQKNSIFEASIENEYEKAKNKLEEIVDEYQSEINENVELSYKIRKGKIHERVVQQARAFDDSAIIMCTYGSSGFDKFFLGSNAYRVISSSSHEIPVISIKDSAPPETINNIVMPIDHTKETRQKLPYTTELAQKFGATVHIVAITTTGQDDIKTRIEGYVKQTEDYLKNNDINYKKDFFEGDNITDIVSEYAEKMDADIISIMAERKRGKKPNLVLGFNSHHLINNTDIPVMSITPQILHKPEESFRTDAYPISGNEKSAVI